jgi:hypothetical protein
MSHRKEVKLEEAKLGINLYEHKTVNLHIKAKYFPLNRYLSFPFRLLDHASGGSKYRVLVLWEWGFGVGLTTLRCKKIKLLRSLQEIQSDFVK